MPITLKALIQLINIMVSGNKIIMALDITNNNKIITGTTIIELKVTHSITTMQIMRMILSMDAVQVLFHVQILAKLQKANQACLLQRDLVEYFIQLNLAI